ARSDTAVPGWQRKGCRLSEDIVLELFGGPGGLAEGARMAGVSNLVGIELDEWACKTRIRAGHRTIRADVSAFDVSRLAGRVTGCCGSPECTTFSMAGSRAGTAVMGILDALIRDLMDGCPTRAAHRREMTRLLRASRYLADAPRQMDAYTWRRD